MRVGGVSVIDPHHLAFNELPPPVHIEQVTADDKIYDATNGLRLPPRTRNLAIDFTALSLVAPEKMRFRYLLEGQDPDWKEVINDRQVQYSNLPPGAYRFRVVASNNSGVWNEAGATLEFSIAPAFYQTRWFQAAMAFSFAALLWAAYQWRVAQLARQFNRTLDARVSERTRIARELHDTLLQSFHGLLLQFQTATYLLPERPAEAREQLDGAIDHAAKAITEGRDAVQGLRTSTVERNDLAMAIRTLGDELANHASAPTSRPTSVLQSRASREIFIRSFVTRSTRLRRKLFAMPSAMRMPRGSRWRSATMTSSSGCVCATTARESIRRCSRTTGSRDTTGCAACRNEPD